jgi:wyosine [tRNA(Phe)-imidazoG37] synthetase (radical SAM superfamily)
MNDNQEKESVFPNQKTVYGPVYSWRFGYSLGIDPIFNISTCSFNCIYCQLGNIQNITNKKEIFVETEKVIADFSEILQKNISFDVITFSGSGEPTLAKNLKEMALGIKKLSKKSPLYILTNATLIGDPLVNDALNIFDKVIVKIDCADEEKFQLVNRPAKGITLQGIVENIKNFKQQFNGEIEVQTMFMPLNKNDIVDLAKILKEINPNVVQLNTPKRPYPLSWHRENRGNHQLIFDYDVRELKKVSEEESLDIEAELKKLTGLEILSIYKK